MSQVPEIFRRNRLLAVILTCLFLPPIALSAYAAENTSGCHCFRNRTFDPAKKFAADEYLLTTTANSLTSGHFNISKRQIVMMKMQGGVSNTDLLIGLHVADVSGSDVSQILESKGEKTWQDTLTMSSKIGRKNNPDELVQQLREGLPADQAAEQIIAAILAKRFGTTPDQLEKFNSSDLSAPETVLVLTLADHSGATPESILSLYRNGRSWSEIANNFGLAPSDVGKLLLPTEKK